MNKIDTFIKENKLEEYFTKKYFDYFLLGVALVLSLYLDWSIMRIIGGLLVLYIFLNPLKSEIYGKATLFFLTLVPITLMMDRDGKAEKLAVAAYGMMVLTVVMSIWETKKEKIAK